jgi:hypothetical protein
MTNVQKKQEVDQVMIQYSAKMADIKQRRDLAIQAFLEKARQRRIQQLKTTLSKNGLS